MPRLGGVSVGTRQEGHGNARDDQRGSRVLRSTRNGCWWVTVRRASAHNVLRGKVRHRSKDRDEVHRRGLELRGKWLAILCLGRPLRGTD